MTEQTPHDSPESSEFDMISVLSKKKYLIDIIYKYIRLKNSKKRRIFLAVGRQTLRKFDCYPFIYFTNKRACFFIHT